MVFFNRPIMARTQILVHSWGPRTRIRRRFADRLNQSLVSSETQAQSLLGNRKRTNEIEETFKVSVTFTLFASFCLKLMDGKWLNHVMKRKCPFDFFS